MKCTIRDELAAPDPDTFWREVFFRETVQESIYRELGCYEAKVEAQEGSLATGLTRRFVFVQPIEAPGPIKKWFGDRQTLREQGAFDARTREYRFTLTLDGPLAKRIAVRGLTRVLSVAAGRIERICELEFECAIPALGGLTERFMAKSNEAIYARRTVIERRVLAALS